MESNYVRQVYVISYVQKLILYIIKLDAFHPSPPPNPFNPLNNQVCELSKMSPRTENILTTLSLLNILQSWLSKLTYNLRRLISSKRQDIILLENLDQSVFCKNMEMCEMKVTEKLLIWI